jgi:hypothetical protein
VPLGRADGEALDVEPAPREHARDAHERARLVLDEHDSVWITAGHRLGLLVLDRSSAAAPAGIIGKQCSARSTRQSTTAVRPQASASASAALELVLAPDA